MNESSSIRNATLRSQPWNTLCLALCRNRAGRVLLHFTALLRHPRNLRWHWQGICREFPLRPRTRVCSKHAAACDVVGTVVTRAGLCAHFTARGTAILRAARVRFTNSKKRLRDSVSCALTSQTAASIQTRRQCE